MTAISVLTVCLIMINVIFRLNVGSMAKTACLQVKYVQCFQHVES
jgi:hypothetical protein